MPTRMEADDIIMVLRSQVDDLEASEASLSTELTRLRAENAALERQAAEARAKAFEEAAAFAGRYLNDALTEIAARARVEAIAGTGGGDEG